MSGNQAPATWIVEQQAGEVLFQEGQAGDSAYVVMAGELELTVGPRAVACLGPGDVCGLLAVLQGTPQALGARARTATRLLKLKPGDLGRVATQPELTGQLLRALARQLETALLPAPAPAQPRLVAEEGGLEFALPADGAILVGRGDARSGFKPDIDLSALDARRSLSRRHAHLMRRGQAWLVGEEPRAANGTFVNGARLAPGEERELRDGDELLFGNVRARFRER